MDVVEACGDLAQAVAQAQDWVSDANNQRSVSLERAMIEQKLRRCRSELMRLQGSASRATCVGLFGPSQAGKSYLVSILARRDAKPLHATFAGDRDAIDFLEEINPAGGQESTGIVTRFTIHPQTSPKGFPVCLKLLTHTDVVKILVNSYFHDGDQEYETPFDAATIEQSVSDAERAASTVNKPTLSEDDVWDIQEYVQRNSGGAASAAALEPFWTRIAAVAPKLSLPARAKLFSLLWGQHETFTTIYTRLVGTLARFDFRTDAFCGLDAILPSRDSIINVESLSGLLDDDAPTVVFSGQDNAQIELTRPLATALIAELRIVCKDTPQPFFAHTDLLDFPGYRTRFKQDLKRYLRDAANSAPKELVLRGKVDYLFQRYSSDLELTTMILCVPESVMEVASLPKAVESWVSMTHGAAPSERTGKPTLLFFAMTRFDRTLEKKAGDREEGYAEKFEIRFNASLSPFAKVEPSWVRQWTPGMPFRNVFLIRNPNVEFRGAITYENKREVELNPTELPRLRALRAAFVNLPSATDHFSDPGLSWDSLLALNDGGAGLLAAALERACRPDLKEQQIVARLRVICGIVLDALGPFYIGGDVEKRRAERLEIVDERIFADLNECAERGTFGIALRGLMIDTSDLHTALVERLSRPGEDVRDDAPRPAPSVRSGPFRSAAKAAHTAAAGLEVERTDRWSLLARTALSSWAVFLDARVNDAVFSRRTGIARASLREIAVEIGSAARRLDLIERIAVELRNRATSNEQNESIARKASLVAERVINRFVAELDFNNIDPPTQTARYADEIGDPVFVPRAAAFDVSGIAPDAPDFAMNFMEQWGRAFRMTVADNAMSNEGHIDNAIQNARLGTILKAVAETAAVSSERGLRL